MDLRPDESLELIDDLKRFQIDHHQVNSIVSIWAGTTASCLGDSDSPTSSQVASRSTQ